MDEELIELKHKLNMVELNYQRETASMVHEWKMSQQRIKTAEIRKMQMRRDAYKQ